MKKATYNRIAMPIGIVLVSSSLLIGHYAKSNTYTDFIRGFAIGLGIALLLISIYRKKAKPVT
jgi:hypothetical protein